MKENLSFESSVSFLFQIERMPPPASTTSAKPTGDEQNSNENGVTTEKNPSVSISPLNKIEKVVVHPLVLLSVVDHFNRMGKIGNSQRVVGILLGSLKNKILDISNSFACKIIPIAVLLLSFSFPLPSAF